MKKTAITMVLPPTTHYLKIGFVYLFLLVLLFSIKIPLLTMVGINLPKNFDYVKILIGISVFVVLVIVIAGIAYRNYHSFGNVMYPNLYLKVWFDSGLYPTTGGLMFFCKKGIYLNYELSKNQNALHRIYLKLTRLSNDSTGFIPYELLESCALKKMNKGFQIQLMCKNSTTVNVQNISLASLKPVKQCLQNANILIKE